MYKAVTTWQAENYDITVMHGAFATVNEAALCASGRGPSGVRSLNLNDGHLALQFNAGGRLNLNDADIEVRALKAAAVGATRPLTIDDFELVALRIRDFAGVPDLTRGFGSQSYGVSDSTGYRLPMPKNANLPRKGSA